MKKKTKEEILKLCRDLDQAIAEDDNEWAHDIYDQIMEVKLKEYNPSFVYRLKKRVKNITFWYA